MLGGAGGVACATCETVRVLDDQDRGGVLRTGLSGVLARLSEPRAAVARIGGEALVLVLPDDGPALPLGHIAAVAELLRDRAVFVLRGLGGVDDGGDHRGSFRLGELWGINSRSAL